KNFFRGAVNLVNLPIHFFPGVGEDGNTRRFCGELKRSGISKSRLVNREGTAVAEIVSGNGGENACAVFGGPRERADLVHGIGKSHRAVAADAAVSGTQAADSAIGRRANNRTPRFGSNRKSRQGRADDRGGTGRGTAGPADGVPRIFGSALQRSVSKAVTHSTSEFDHCGFADQNRADTVEMF